MPNINCDVCQFRPAVRRVTAGRNGTKETYNLCRFHYEEIERDYAPRSVFHWIIIGRSEDAFFSAKKIKLLPTPILDRYSRDLTRLAEEGALDPIIGRSHEIETVLEILARRKKNNPILVGHPGVGKTAIAEGLAYRIARGEVPDEIKNKRVIELDLNALVAGAKHQGELEERLQNILRETVKNKNEIYLFIDEIHTITSIAGAGENAGLGMANILKPYLARGDLHLIGATTHKEYRHIVSDEALERRFQPVTVEEPSVEETMEILRGLRERYEEHHGIIIRDEALHFAASLSSRYITGRFLPDKAIDLIDTSASHNRLRKERGHKELTGGDVAKTVSKLTGIPVFRFADEQKKNLLGIEEILDRQIIGQKKATRAVAEAIRRSQSGFGQSEGRPLATFLFLGPTGVGKTELAKVLAELVFRDRRSLIRIDMNEYIEAHTVNRLFGSPPGYIGYGDAGQLTEAIRRRPYSVVLLDEIEKAHPEVHNILLQLFDEGYLTDGKGQKADFTNAVIIATSNIQVGSMPDNPFWQDWNIFDERKSDILKNYFRPEFLNRLDEIIMFRSLDKNDARMILELELESLKKKAGEKNIRLDFTKRLLEWLLEKGFSPEYGAREIKRTVRKYLESRLVDANLRGELSPVDFNLVDIDPGSQTISLKKIGTEFGMQPNKETYDRMKGKY